VPPRESGINASPLPLVLAHIISTNHLPAELRLAQPPYRDGGLKPTLQQHHTTGGAGAIVLLSCTLTWPLPGKNDMISSMESLLQSNPYLADPRNRKAMLRQNARESSILEGARGLPARAAAPVHKRRSRAATKKALK
jgi:hypothetical protein